MKVKVEPPVIDGEKFYDAYASFSYIIDSTDKKPVMMAVAKFLSSLNNTKTPGPKMLAFMMSKFIDDIGAPDVCFASQDGETIYMLYGDDQHNHGSGIQLFIDQDQDTVYIRQTDEIFGI